MKCSESNRERGEVMSYKRKGEKLCIYFEYLWLAFGLSLLASLFNTFVEHVREDDIKYVNGSYVGRSRSKRFIYMGNDRRLNLPPHSLLEIETTFSVPGLNPLPIGFLNSLAISVPFDVDFDELGMTSEDNTFGRIPFLDSIIEFFSPIGNFTANVKESYQEHHDIHYNKSLSKYTYMRSNGGHRSLVYQVIEDAFYNAGVNGKACLLRIICDLHSHSLFGYGLVGEIIELILTVSDSDDPLDVLGDYLDAELTGRSSFSSSSVSCSKYNGECPLSFFGPPSEQNRLHEEKVRQKFMDDESNYADYHLEGENYGNRLTREVVLHMKSNHSARESLSRQKRFIFFGPAGNLRLPFGSLYVIKPNMILPWMTNLPKGYKSKLKVGVPLKIEFDILGLTSLLNPFLRVPFANVGGRKKRSAWRPLPGVNYEGGDREYIYTLLEEKLESWGFDGQGCLLRAICETHLSPLQNHGLVGEIFNLFFTPSKSLHANIRLKEYVEAEKLGNFHQYCKPYFKKCPYSLFITEKEKSNRVDEWRSLSRRSNEEDSEEEEEEKPLWM